MQRSGSWRRCGSGGCDEAARALVSLWRVAGYAAPAILVGEFLQPARLKAKAVLEPALSEQIGGHARGKEQDHAGGLQGEVQTLGRGASVQPENGTVFVGLQIHVHPARIHVGPEGGEGPIDEIIEIRAAIFLRHLIPANLPQLSIESMLASVLPCKYRLEFLPAR